MRALSTHSAEAGSSSGMRMMSMAKFAVFGSSSELAPEQRASSVAERTVAVPEPYTYRSPSFSPTIVWVCEPLQVCTSATFWGFVGSEMSKTRMPRNTFCGLAAPPGSSAVDLQPTRPEAASTDRISRSP